MVFAIAYGGHIRMFDVRKYEKVFFYACFFVKVFLKVFCCLWKKIEKVRLLWPFFPGSIWNLCSWRSIWSQCVRVQLGWQAYAFDYDSWTYLCSWFFQRNTCLFFLQLSWLLDWFLKNISCQHVVLLFSSQINSFNVKAVSSEATLDASFSPDGLYIVSGKTSIFTYMAEKLLTLQPEQNIFSMCICFCLRLLRSSLGANFPVLNIHIYSLFSGSGDGSVTAWNIRSGKEVMPQL